MELVKPLMFIAGALMMKTHNELKFGEYQFARNASLRDVVDTIIDRIGSPDSGMFIDAFSGTGAVAEAASRAGWKVHVNDHLSSSAIMSFARLVSKADVLFSGLGGYASAVDVLNSLKPQRGFIWREYSHNIAEIHYD